jgi:hypothetical protein
MGMAGAEWKATDFAQIGLHALLDPAATSVILEERDLEQTVSRDHRSV